MGNAAWRGAIIVHDLDSSVRAHAAKPGLDLQDHGSCPVRKHDLGAFSVSSVESQIVSEKGVGGWFDDIVVLCDPEDQLGPLQKHARVDLHFAQSTTTPRMEESKERSDAIRPTIAGSSI